VPHTPRRGAGSPAGGGGSPARRRRGRSSHRIAAPALRQRASGPRAARAGRGARASRRGADRAAATSGLPLGLPPRLGKTGGARPLTCAAGAHCARCPARGQGGGAAAARWPACSRCGRRRRGRNLAGLPLPQPVAPGQAAPRRSSPGAGVLRWGRPPRTERAHAHPRRGVSAGGCPGVHCRGASTKMPCVFPLRLCHVAELNRQINHVSVFIEIKVDDANRSRRHKITHDVWRQ